MFDTEIYKSLKKKTKNDLANGWWLQTLFTRLSCAGTTCQAYITLTFDLPEWHFQMELLHMKNNCAKLFWNPVIELLFKTNPDGQMHKCKHAHIPILWKPHVKIFMEKGENAGSLLRTNIITWVSVNLSFAKAINLEMWFSNKLKYIESITYIPLNRSIHLSNTKVKLW